MQVIFEVFCNCVIYEEVWRNCFGPISVLPGSCLLQNTCLSFLQQGENNGDGHEYRGEFLCILFVVKKIISNELVYLFICSI